MDAQFLFHWLTKLFTYISHKDETLDELKTSLENLCQQMIQLSEFFQYSSVLILKRKCLVRASRVRSGESGTPSTIIYTRWSSRRYELGCHIPVCMMTSSNGDIFRIAGPLCGELTGPGEFPAQRPVTRSFDVFFDLRPNKRVEGRSWIYVQHVNLAFLGGRPIHLRATRKFTGQ